MIIKTEEKQRAIKLRQQGLSYNEILAQVPVAKSTLSVWLRDTGLSKRQQQRFSLNRKIAQEKAQAACRRIRTEKEVKIIRDAKREIGRISHRELWIIGTMLYWAEGSKQKAHNVSQKVSFNNSDPQMILLFDKWVQEICGRKKSELTYSIYIHRTADLNKAKGFWEALLETKIEKIYFKNHQPKTNRKNLGTDYRGLLRVDVQKSTDLNRKIKGWIIGINDGIKD